MIRNKMLFFSQLSHIFWTNITQSTFLWSYLKLISCLLLLKPEHSNEKNKILNLPKKAAVKYKYWSQFLGCILVAPTQCVISEKEKMIFWPHLRGQGCVLAQNIS